MNHDDFDRLDIVSLKVAKELKGAGLEWKPKMGDWCVYEHDATDIPVAPILVKTIPLEGEFIYLLSSYLWLPRRRDLELVLEEMGYTEQRLNLHRPPYSGYEFYADSIEQDKWADGSAATPADAVAQAWYGQALPYLEAK